MMLLNVKLMSYIANAHIIKGCEVQSLAWAAAQFGWIAGPGFIVALSLVTCYTSLLLAYCYSSPDPDPVTRRENYVKLFGTLGTIAFCYSSSLIKIQVLCRILSNSLILGNRSMALWQ
jgi:acyl-coenzyme A synthetase/AMP-(fatty) acid ligase